MDTITWSCSVCMEIADPYTIDPCGHSFCFICCQKSKQCPSCSVGINKLST